MVSFVSEQSSMYMEDGNKRWMEKRRPGRQAGSSRDQVQDKEGLIQVTISMDGQENWKIFKTKKISYLYAQMAWLYSWEI